MEFISSLNNLNIFILVALVLLFSESDAQEPGAYNETSQSLDSLLQDYAYKAFIRPRTGVVYTASVPQNISGVKLEAVRLRHGSFWRKGINYNEFQIPAGVRVLPYVQRFALIYQNLGNWSAIYYSVPGHTLISPVLGLLAYDASNLTAINLPVLQLNASKEPISIEFGGLKVPNGMVPKCVWFDLNGSVKLTDLLPRNMCSTSQQGHFSVVVESNAQAPSPTPAKAPPTPIEPPRASTHKKGTSNVWKITVASVIGGLVIISLFCFLVIGLLRYQKKSKFAAMERYADQGEALHMATVGNTKAPAAPGTRTQPVLEHEYVA
ncbi:hypothetical protein AMTRI_Chr10g7810 [Amborella trichopoda]|uniref:Malectin-like domain-containing protein n=1 Tax=Amborella trichopoda TaxID=13333 RepID=U5DAB8_AMBTC|nr:uncharacterized protein LOC18447519 [Amborella trichopoda]ERN19145.1 hypothetical protein AMTR_s00061p00162330 [Amborella trichopoda]|eukprot:XP_006857678.1 uncharacterized protein LOC18447519 [Amborella trichopoda]